MPPRELTPTQRKLLRVLHDRRAHSAHELFRCLPDDLGAVSNVQPHLSRLRRVLRDRGQEIRCEQVNGRVTYRLIRTAS